jgi:hypothetical protein
MVNLEEISRNVLRISQGDLDLLDRLTTEFEERITSSRPDWGEKPPTKSSASDSRRSAFQSR